MNIKKSAIRRSSVTVILGAIAIGGILAATEAQAHRPDTAHSAGVAYRSSAQATKTARTRMVEMRVDGVKANSLNDLGVDYSDFQNDAPKAKKETRRRNIFNRLNFRL